MAIDDAPRVGGKISGDRLTIREWRRYPDISGDREQYARLSEALAAMTAGGPDADEVYAQTLKQLSDDEGFVTLLLKTHDAVEESSYQDRWALLQLAIDLRHPAAGTYLAKFVRRPIPEERVEDTAHGVSTVTEEVILRTTAIEGLARLFQRDFDSSKALLEVIGSSDYVAMRRAAWFALVDGGQDKALKRARKLLEKDGFGWIADIRRIPVEQAEQHNPDLIYPDRKRLGEIPRPFKE
jgi:MyTH4 domain